MSHRKQEVLDTCAAGLAGKQVLEETMEHMRESWTDRRRANLALRQLGAVANLMEKQATTMACKNGMAVGCNANGLQKWHNPPATGYQLYFGLDQC